MERTVDLAAVGRVAKRVDLKGVRLTEISAKCDAKILGSLEPEVDVDCKLGEHDSNRLEVICDYTFNVHSNQAKVVDAAIRYLLLYELTGAEDSADEDLAEFARANGALHSWPFARELLYGLTSRMGYPPYTLPVMHFNPNPVVAEPEQGSLDNAQPPNSKT